MGAYGLQVDHITPLERGGASFDPANLQTLCQPCHLDKTAGENSVTVLRPDTRRAWDALVGKGL